MSDRCEPKVGTSNQTRHWLRKNENPNWDITPIWYDGFWTWGGRQISAAATYAEGFRYLAPVATPAEVEALRAMLSTAMAERDAASLRSNARQTMLAQSEADVATLRARVSELESAMRAIEMCAIPLLSSVLDELAGLITTQAGYDALSVALERARRALEGGV